MALPRVGRRAGPLGLGWGSRLHSLSQRWPFPRPFPGEAACLPPSSKTHVGDDPAETEAKASLNKDPKAHVSPGVFLWGLSGSLWQMVC